MLEWKDSSQGTSVLMIDGARRVGKSYITREFAKKEYKSYIIIDFNNIDDDLKAIFDKYLKHLDDLFKYLQLYTGVTLYERDSVIIFDEVQFYPQVRSALKYLVEDGRYDYIETGSLISIQKNVKDIMIPSEEDRIDMYPMDFEEFLWAKNEDILFDLIEENYVKRQPMGHFHRKAMKLLREYIVVGGMPQAVQAFVDGKNFKHIDAIKRKILNLYRNDIMKYADGWEERVRDIFDSIPNQLNRHEKKFRLSDLRPNARMRDYESAMFWLIEAMIVNPCYNSTEPNIGLSMNQERTTLKCYMGDTGLLVSMANDEIYDGENTLYTKIVTDKLEVNHGMIIENLVSQLLRASGHKLYFFSSYSKSVAIDRMEIDFLIRKRNVTSRHNIIPIEVKSTSRYTLTSLNKFISKYKGFVDTPIVFHTGDYVSEGGIIYLPLYMAALL